jgi:hypothetical protein
MSEALAEQTEGLPDAEAVIKELIHGNSHRWNPSTDDYERMVGVLDEIAPVQAYYIPTRIPTLGVAPDDIKEEWIGLRLPVRSKSETEGEPGFTIMAREALEVLSQERPRADAWWRNHYVKEVERKTEEVREKRLAEGDYLPYDWRGYVNHPNNEFDEYIVNFDHLTFDPEEGIILPEPRYLGSLMTHDVLVAEAVKRQFAS